MIMVVLTHWPITHSRDNQNQIPWKNARIQPAVSLIMLTSNPEDACRETAITSQSPGTGWQGESLLAREHPMDIEMSDQLFYQQRNLKDRIASFQAYKPHKLRYCSIIIQYHARETINYDSFPITLLVSEFVGAELLSGFLDKDLQKSTGPRHAVRSLRILFPAPLRGDSQPSRQALSAALLACSLPG